MLSHIWSYQKVLLFTPSNLGHSLSLRKKRYETEIYYAFNVFFIKSENVIEKCLMGYNVKERIIYNLKCVGNLVHVVRLDSRLTVSLSLFLSNSHSE